MFESDALFMHQNFQLICRDKECSIYQLKNETGDGIVIYYQLYPGIAIMYNNFHISNNKGRDMEGGDYISIHHCKEGRVESEAITGEYLYLEPGDVILENHSTAEYSFCGFPLNYYYGVSIVISMTDIIINDIRKILELYSIDFEEIEKKFFLKKGPCVIRGDSLTNHIFSEFYSIPDAIKTEYLRVKVVELLLSLKVVDTSNIRKIRPYFCKAQVEKVKAIKEYMIQSPEIHYTIKELAEKFDISESSLKRCFKGIYGIAIYSYMKKYRMNIAMTLLTESNESIANIAGKIGYSNSSKFAEAFKSLKGTTPLEYRKIKI